MQHALFPCIDFSHDVPVQEGRTWTREGERAFANKYADTVAGLTN